MALIIFEAHPILSSMKSCMLLVLVTMPIVGFAQSKNTEAQASDNSRARTQIGDDGFDAYAFNLRDKSVRGTPMLSSQWQPAEILLVGNTKPMAAPVKYDIHQHELRVRRPQGDSIIVPSARVQEFSFIQLSAQGSMQPRRFMRYQSPSLPAELNGTCAEILAGGKTLQLLKFWNKTLVKEPENNANIASTSTIQRYDESNKYYVRWVSDGQLMAVRLKRGSLKEALAGHPKALSELDAQKGPLNTEVDAKAAIAAIDENAK